MIPEHVWDDRANKLILPLDIQTYTPPHLTLQEEFVRNGLAGGGSDGLVTELSGSDP